MQWNDLSEFFEERKKFFPTLENWKKISSGAAVYLFLTDTLEKVGRIETDIVYIGETIHLGGNGRSGHNCRLWDYHMEHGVHEKAKVTFMRKLAADHKTMISWRPCLNKQSAQELEDLLLKTFFSEHGRYPLLQGSGFETTANANSYGKGCIDTDFKK